MLAAGAGYAIVRRKRSHKGTTLLLACMLLLGFTQCKKEAETTIPTDGVPMTLQVTNVAKTSISESGAIDWTAGDKIYVVFDGSCVGYVQNTANDLTTFTGTVTGVSTGTHTFHYYYVGNSKTIANGDTSFEMDFSNQTGTLADLGNYQMGYGSQELSYTGGEISTEAEMTMLVSIGYFDIAGMAQEGEKVFMYGDNLNNKISIDFSNNAIANTQVDPLHNNNYISLGTVTAGTSCGRYVMMVPNDGSETEITFVSKRTSGSCTFSEGVEAGNFYCKGGNTSTPLTLSPVAFTKGALRGEFTIDANGTKVHFSQGNLKAVTDDTWLSYEWYFMDNQYDIVERTKDDIADEYYGKTAATLLGWGTSGYDHGATYYQPYNTNFSGKYYKAYNSSYTNLYSSTGKADWGYNAIKNSISEENKWRTLKLAEFQYLFQTRTDAADKWGYATVNDMHGIIVLPDSFDDPYKNNGSDAFDGSSTGWSANVYGEEDWNDYMEPAGAVFLPAAGQRVGGNLNQTYGGAQFKPGDYGFYWTSDKEGGTSMASNNAYTIKFVNNSLSYPVQTKAWGQSVRLVLK